MQKVTTIVTGCIAFVVVTAMIAFLLSGEKNFIGWFNGHPFSWKTTLVGLVYGLAFGLIDNVLLLLGVEGMKSLYEKFPGGKDHTVSSLYGNTFASVVSAFGATFIADIIAYETHISSGPVWGQALGIFLGCLLVIFSRLIFQSSRRSAHA